MNVVKVGDVPEDRLAALKENKRLVDEWATRLEEELKREKPREDYEVYKRAKECEGDLKHGKLGKYGVVCAFYAAEVDSGVEGAGPEDIVVKARILEVRLDTLFGFIVHPDMSVSVSKKCSVEWNGANGVQGRHDGFEWDKLN